MLSRTVPIFMRHAPTPGVVGFAVLAGIEASVRGLLVSIWPLAIYQAMGEDAASVSLLYFGAGIASLFWGLMIPWVSRTIPRRWVYSAGVSLYLLSALMAIYGGPVLTPLAMMFANFATVTVFICTNAYVMDYIARHDLGRGETLRVQFTAIPWTIGPMLGVFLWKYWAPLPFILTIGFEVMLLAAFWYLRLGNGKTITRARAPAPNPLAYIGRFFQQPRLVAGWIFAVLRSSGWWVYVVYLPMFCIEAGLGDQTGSIVFSISNAILLTSPLMLRWMHRVGLRWAIQFAFAGCAACFLAATLGIFWPPIAVAALFFASIFLVMLDTYGGLPFLLAVRPAERTEMAAVFSSYRDASGILTPGVAWVVLSVAPIAGIFVAFGLALGATVLVAGRMHPRTGERRPVAGRS